MSIDFELHACATKTTDPSLVRYLIVDFKNRQFVELKACNFDKVSAQTEK